MSQNESVVLIDDSDADNNEKHDEEKTDQNDDDDDDNDENNQDESSNRSTNSPNGKDQTVLLNDKEERDEEKTNENNDYENNDESSNRSTNSPNEKAKDKTNNRQQRPPPLPQAGTSAVPTTISTTKKPKPRLPSTNTRNKYVRDQFIISESDKHEGKVRYVCMHCPFEKHEIQFRTTRARHHLAAECPNVPRGICLRARQSQKELLNKFIKDHFTISKAAELNGKTNLVCKHCPFEKTVDYFYPKIATDHLVNDCPNVSENARREARLKPNPNEINEEKDIMRSQFDWIPNQDGISFTVVCRHCGEKKLFQKNRPGYIKKHVLEECRKIPRSVRRAAKNAHDDDYGSTDSIRKRKAEDWAGDKVIDCGDDSDDVGTFPKKTSAIGNGQANRKRAQEEEEDTSDDDAALPLKKMRPTTELAQLQVQEKRLELEGKKFEQKMSQVRSKIEMTYGLLEKRQKLIDQGVSLEVIDQVLPLSLVNVNGENGPETERDANLTHAEM